MAVAASALLWENAGSQMTTSGTLTFSGTYATGGQAITAAALGLGSITSLEINQGEDGYVFKWDPANSKILIYTVPGFTPAGSAIFTGDPLGTHDHTAVVIDATETAGDVTAFVPLLDGTGAAVAGTTIGNAGGAGADIDVPTSADSAGTPAGTVVFTGTPVAAGALAQLANGASLTNIVTQFKAWGY